MDRSFGDTKAQISPFFDTPLNIKFCLLALAVLNACDPILYRRILFQTIRNLIARCNKRVIG